MAGNGEQYLWYKESILCELLNKGQIDRQQNKELKFYVGRSNGKPYTLFSSI